MPTVLCPFCVQPTALPDPWLHPGYTCPHCRATVAFAAASPAPPAPADPFDLSDEPRRVRRPVRSTRRNEEGANPLLIIGGYVCALFSLVIFPPALGIAGLVFGTVCLTQRAVGNGMLIVVLSLVFATIGMIWGAEVAFFGKPQFLLR